MAVTISGVNKDSLCGKKGIAAGFSLISVNGHEINDVLDYRFYASAKRITAVFKDCDNAELTIHLKTKADLDSSEILKKLKKELSRE